MGLFDDILKKPQDTTPADPIGQGSSGQSGTGDDTSTTGTATTPIIQKTESVSLFDNPIVQETASTSSIQDNPTNTPAVIIEETPIVSEETHPTPVASPVIETESSSILGFSTPATEKEDTTDTSSAMGNLFGNGGSTSDTKTPLHPKDFIEKSIKDIDLMIGDIDKAHEAKISEAEGYGKEKEKFSTLETTAYTEAASLDEEKEQALHVRALLEGELDTTTKQENALEALTHTAVETTETPTENLGETAIQKSAETIETSSIGQGTVETTLTGLAVQNTVTETITPTESTSSLIVGESEKTEETGVVTPTLI